MIKHCGSVLTWFVLALLMYGAGDVVEKGQALNAITGFPFLGYALWILILGFVWWILIKPLFDFWRLSQRSCRSLEDRAKSLHRRLTYRKKTMEGDGENFPDAGLMAYGRLDEAIKRKRWDVVEPILEECVPYDTLHEEEKTVMLSHAKAAAIAVAFSHNSILDGICMLIVQLRLVVALARLHGYKPSPVFNVCCLIWISANSIVAAWLNTATGSVMENAFSIKDNGMTEDGFGDALADLTVSGVDDGFLLGVEAVGQRIASFTVGILLEAVISGSAVYVTGKLFSAKLNGEWEKPTLASLIKLRREGRCEIGKNIPNIMKGLVSNIGTLGKDTIAAAYDRMHDVLFKSEGRNGQ